MKILDMRTVGLLVLCALAAYGCSSPAPLQKLIQDNGRYEEFSIVLEDMNAEEGMFAKYFHKYKVVRPETEPEVTDWLEVTAKFYTEHANHLGMTLAAKQAGQVEDYVAPAGYSYVGNDRYGGWRADSSGRSFWVFYGQYRLLSDLFGRDRVVYRNDYDSYRSYRSQNRTYYGSNNEYGTNGAATQQTHKDFFARKQARTAASQKSFSDKVSSRTSSGKTSRSSSSYRGRSGGSGK